MIYITNRSITVAKVNRNETSTRIPTILRSSTQTKEPCTLDPTIEIQGIQLKPKKPTVTSTLNGATPIITLLITNLLSPPGSPSIIPTENRSKVPRIPQAEVKSSTSQSSSLPSVASSPPEHFWSPSAMGLLLKGGLGLLRLMI